uniref:Organic solute transporter subunit alpha-like n=1 Tax=Phallusia mammillata TaxID=59560 RepID=A0A6F9DN26_9ASCI|nr:organic solute transporter subunit alpha-like [Phallusia mammillata]
MERGKTNCTYDSPPNITTLFTDVTERQIILLSICSAFFVATVVLFIVESVLFVQRQESKTSARHLIYIQGTFAAYSLMSFLGVVSPLSSLMCEFVFSVYFSFTLKEFVDLMLHILENKGVDEEQESDCPQTVSLAAPPLACCFICICPHVKINSKFFKYVKIGVYQVVILRPLCTFIEAVLWTNGYYGFAKEDFGIELLEILSAVAVLVAMYFMKLLYNGHVELFKPHYITMKFYCIQIVMIIVTIQQAIFHLLVEKGVIPCRDPFNSAVRGSVIHHVLVLPEMLLLSIFSSGICRKWSQQTQRDSTSLAKETTPLLVDQPFFE